MTAAELKGRVENARFVVVGLCMVISIANLKIAQQRARETVVWGLNVKHCVVCHIGSQYGYFGD